MNFKKSFTSDINQFNNLSFKKILAMKNLNFDGKNKLDNFEILDKLGQGSFGKVFKVRYKLNNCIYALKRIPKNYNDDGVKEKYIWREIEILTQLRHPNIIKYYETFEDKNYIYLIIEYANNGSLVSFLYNRSLEKIKLFF
jgi:serine/threonine protein kinase